MQNSYLSSNSVYLISNDELSSIENTINLFVQLIPIYYVVSWGVIVIIMFPLIGGALANVKNEIRYLFSIYLTIPR